MSTDKKLEYIKMLDLLSETFGDSSGQSPEEIREEVQKEGFDIDAAELSLARFQQEISKEAKRQILDEAKNRREALKEKQKEILDRFVGWSKDQLIEFFKNIPIEKSELSIAYRDLEKKKDEDIKAILVDIELIKLLESEENNNDAQ